MELKPEYLEKAKEFMKKVYGLDFDPDEWEFIGDESYIEVNNEKDSALSFVLRCKNIGDESYWEKRLSENAEEYKEELLDEVAALDKLIDEAKINRGNTLLKLLRLGIVP